MAIRSQHSYIEPEAKDVMNFPVTEAPLGMEALSISRQLGSSGLTGHDDGHERPGRMEKRRNWFQSRKADFQAVLRF